jgi:hypothetical protein
MRGALVALLLLMIPAAAWADRGFPFDQELLLEVPPMRPVKRVPILQVAPNGAATIDLWCKTVNARVEVSNGTIRIEPGPLPEGLPPMMVSGQCSPERMRADEDVLVTLSQVTAWQWKGNLVVLSGTTMLKFRPSSH